MYYRSKEKAMRLSLTILLLLVTLPVVTFGQSFEGKWVGFLAQDGKVDTFYYEMQLQKDGSSFFGQSFSKTKDDQHTATFDLSAVLSNHTLLLQEMKQLSPEQPKWCLKYITLQLDMEDNTPVLKGRWSADGCVPGDVYLKAARSPNNIEPTTAFIEKPFDILGKWTGYLKQEDRDYGFYYEFELAENGGGSYIVSEGNGGSARHELEWSFNPKDSTIHLEEMHILNQSKSKWRWCIKSADLILKRQKHAYTLTGAWGGYIEGFTVETGPCASGEMFLEKPIAMTTQGINSDRLKSIQQPVQGRKVNLQRVIEVKSRRLKIKVWDNGTVDGDVATVIVNGKVLFENYRVTKTKFGKLVELQHENNMLVLHAEDLGDIAPNTVAVSIDDGHKEQLIILSSNLSESGAVLVKSFNINE